MLASAYYLMNSRGNVLDKDALLSKYDHTRDWSVHVRLRLLGGASGDDATPSTSSGTRLAWTSRLLVS